MTAKPKRIGNWTPDGRAEAALARREFEETTPGQRVEQAMILSAELSRLAVRGLERAKSERA
jgi:hypothetical protein